MTNLAVYSLSCFLGRQGDVVIRETWARRRCVDYKPVNGSLIPPVSYISREKAEIDCAYRAIMIICLTKNNEAVTGSTAQRSLKYSKSQNSPPPQPHINTCELQVTCRIYGDKVFQQCMPATPALPLLHIVLSQCHIVAYLLFIYLFILFFFHRTKIKNEPIQSTDKSIF